MAENSIAFVFPGQGSQKVGMMKDLYDGFEEVREIFDTASETLGYDMAALCFEGPAEELNRTVRTQPALLTASTAADRVLKLRGIKPQAVAGHSLGEYSALVSVGALGFADTLRLVEKRARLMQEAVAEGKGLMAAILGLEKGQVDELCLDVRSGYVRPANYNCPGQIVISGEKHAVEDAMARAKEAGAKRALPLSVSVPSHCALMEEASKALGEYLFLENVHMKAPEAPLVTNLEANFVTTVDGIKASLTGQLNHPVLWEQSIRIMEKEGYSTFIEVGPGTVLGGLIRRIAPGATILNVQDQTSLEKTTESLRSHM